MALDKSAGGVQTLELSQLGLSQLENLKAQLDEEIRLLSESMNGLKVAQQKFVDSKEAIKKLTERKGNEILVPLSASMYAPGQLDITNPVLIDIGTGYYAGKNLDGAEKYFKRKIAFLTKQMEALQPSLIEKHRVRQALDKCIILTDELDDYWTLAIIDTMSSKIRSQMSNPPNSAAKT